MNSRKFNIPNLQYIIHHTEKKNASNIYGKGFKNDPEVQILCLLIDIGNVSGRILKKRKKNLVMNVSVEMHRTGGWGERGLLTIILSCTVWSFIKPGTCYIHIHIHRFLNYDNLQE